MLLQFRRGRDASAAAEEDQRNVQRNGAVRLQIKTRLSKRSAEAVAPNWRRCNTEFKKFVSRMHSVFEKKIQRQTMKQKNPKSWNRCEMLTRQGAHTRRKHSLLVWPPVVNWPVINNVSLSFHQIDVLVWTTSNHLSWNFFPMPYTLFPSL